jgi:hypothetical protein
MRILDLWCGSKSATQAFADAGHEVISVDIDPQWNPTICKDILDVTLQELEAFGRFDFIWASPDCSVFTIAAAGQGHFLLPDVEPRTRKAKDMVLRIMHTRFLCENLWPRIGFMIENPRGLLRKLPILRGLGRRTVTYCSYGDGRMKPTDLWGVLPGWASHPPCYNENPNCHHERSPRGSDSGTQGLEWSDRIRIPIELSREIFEACEFYKKIEDWGTLDKWGIYDERA